MTVPMICRAHRQYGFSRSLVQFRYMLAPTFFARRPYSGRASSPYAEDTRDARPFDGIEVPSSAAKRASAEGS